MPDLSELRIEPAAATLEAARLWLAPVRAALGDRFLSAYLTGSVLTQGFDPKRSQINLLVLSRSLGDDTLAAIAAAIPAPKKPYHFDPLFLTRQQLEKSLDVFPIEYLEMRERHLLLEGEDVIASIVVPLTYLRLQCEHELRGKHIRLRQSLLRHWNQTPELGEQLAASASSFATLFRTLLRLRGETPPGDPAHVIERVADLYRLDAQALLGAHLARTAGVVRRDDAQKMFRRFVAELDKLIVAIDELRVP
jgi:hypothetical protein